MLFLLGWGGRLMVFARGVRVVVRALGVGMGPVQAGIK